jgi:simple sugar transport system permease protein
MRKILPRFKIPEKILWSLIVLTLLLLFNLAFTQGFFHLEMREGRLFGSLIDILDRAAPLMLVSLGMTLVLATGGVDLSVGAVMAIAGAICAGLIARPGFSVLSRLGLPESLLMALGLALAAALFAGFINGILISLFDIQPIVATLILMVAGRGIAQLLTDGQIITFQNESLTFIGNGYFLFLPFTLTIVAVVAVMMGFFMRKTALGLFIESCGDNPVASHYAGVNIRMVKLLIYLFSGFCAGMAGIIVASDIKAADANNAGLYLELDAILATVLGGTALKGGRFFLAGTLIGAVLIQSVTTTILTRGVPVEYTLVVKALVIVILCLLQSVEFRRFWAFKFRRNSA